MSIEDVLHDGRAITIFLMDKDSEGVPDAVHGKYKGQDAGGILIYVAEEENYIFYPWHSVWFVTSDREQGGW